MVGQAFIKAIAFAVNTAVLYSFFSVTPAEATLLELVFSAGMSGFVTSFFVNPIERVKILMQADNARITVSRIYIYYISNASVV